MFFDYMVGASCWAFFGVSTPAWMAAAAMVPRNILFTGCFYLLGNHLLVVIQLGDTLYWDFIMENTIALTQTGNF